MSNFIDSAVKSGHSFYQNSPSRREIEKEIQQEVQDTDYTDLRNAKRKVNLCILVLPFILAVLFTIWSVKLIKTQLNTTKQLEGADNVLDFLHHNLNENPIQKWRSSENGSCPGNYQEAVLGEWEGIKSGCICSDGNTNTNESKTKCLTLKKNGCNFQLGKGDEDFEYWVDSTSYCENRLDSDKWVKTAECKTSENTLCGPSVCIKGQEAQCPPNDVSVAPLSDPSSELSKIVKGFGDDKQSNFNELIIKNASKGQPAIAMTSKYDAAKKSTNSAYVNFVISQGETLCLNKDYAKTQNQIYALDEQQSSNNSCDSFGALNAKQVVVLDSASQKKVYEVNPNLNGVYSSSLENYNPADYQQNQMHLLAIQKVPLAEKAACTKAYDSSISTTGKLAQAVRTGLRWFSYILIAFCVITLILGIIFLLAAVSRKISNQPGTKKKIAKFYWFSAWILVAIAIIVFILYHTVFTGYIQNNEDDLKDIQKGECFPGNPGFGSAIGRLIEFDKETDEKFGPIVNYMFIAALVYAALWLGIIALWRRRFSKSRME